MEFTDGFILVEKTEISVLHEINIIEGRIVRISFIYQYDYGKKVPSTVPICFMVNQNHKANCQKFTL